MSNPKEKIIEFLKENGPALPNEIAKHIQKPLLITSAILSEMVESKQLKFSNLKIGSSPLYYIEGQEEKLEKFIEKLNQREKEAVQLLKKEKILRDDNLSPVIRVALRNARDFAKPLKVNVKGEQIIFWRYFSLSNEEAIQIIKEKLKGEVSKEKIEQKKVEERIEEVKEEIKEKERKIEKIEKKEEGLKQEKKEIEVKEKQERKIEKQELVVKPEKKEKRKSKKKEEKQLVEKCIQLLKEEFDTVEKIDEDKFICKKKMGVGEIRYLCIIKNKKKINEADLSLVYQEGQNKKMPVLMLTSGTLTKKAKSFLSRFGDFLLVSFIKD